MTEAGHTGTYQFCLGYVDEAERLKGAFSRRPALNK
jgi:hypothetical protein